MQLPHPPMSEPQAMTSVWRAPRMRSLTPSEHAGIRIGLALIPVMAWLVVAWGSLALEHLPAGRIDKSGHIKGHDFVHFYVLGEIGRDRALAELYDAEAQAARNDRLVPEYTVRYLPIHAPQVALFLAPLAQLPYLAALNAWLAGTVILYLLCCVLMVRTLPNLRPYAPGVALCCVAFPGFYGVMASGQITVFALLWLTLAYLALKSRRSFVAGLFFGTLVYKPTLGLVLPFVLLYAREWRVIAGALTVAVLQFVVVWMYFGPDPIFEYFANFRTAVTAIGALEAQPWQMHSLRAFFTNSLPWPRAAAMLSSLVSVAVIAFAARTWGSAMPLQVRYAVLVMATVLVSPHVYTYELLVLAPALLLAASVAIPHGRSSLLLWAVLYLVFAMPALPTLAVAAHVQWSVPALAALMVIVALPRWSAETIATGTT